MPAVAVVAAATSDPERTAAAARLIAASRCPMIFVGGGAFDASEEILELAERLDAPVVAFRSGRGIVSNAHELGLTIAEAYKLWPQVDLMIGIGSRDSNSPSGAGRSCRRESPRSGSTSTRRRCAALSRTRR